MPGIGILCGNDGLQEENINNILEVCDRLLMVHKCVNECDSVQLKCHAIP